MWPDFREYPRFRVAIAQENSEEGDNSENVANNKRSTEARIVDVAAGSRKCFDMISTKLC